MSPKGDILFSLYRMYDRTKVLKKKKVIDADVSPLREISMQFYASPIVISKRAYKRLFKTGSACRDEQVTWYNALWASIHRVIDYPVKSVGLFPVSINGRWEVFKISYFVCEQGKTNLLVLLEKEKLAAVLGKAIKSQCFEIDGLTQIGPADLIAPQSF